MLGRLAIVLCLLSFVLSATAGGAYTNLAGRIIAATPTKVEGGQVFFSRNILSGQSNNPTIQQSNNQTISVPLAVFPASEQKRIKAALGLREIPSELKALALEIAAQHRRAEARTKAGRMSTKKLAEYNENLAGSWSHAVDGAKLSDEEKSYWRNHCP